MRILGILIIMVLDVGCDFVNTEEKRKKEAQKYIKYIHDNQDDFDGLVEDIISEDDIIDERLKKLNIESYSVIKTNCSEVEFSTNWTSYPIGKLYLTYSTCNQTESEKGYYSEQGFIEVWGVGNNWIIHIDSDAI